MKYFWSKICFLIILNINLVMSMNLAAAKTKIQHVLQGRTAPNGIFDWLALLSDSVDVLSCLPHIREDNCYKSRTCRFKGVKVEGQMLPFVLKVCPDSPLLSIDFLTRDPTQPPPGGIPLYRYYNKGIVDHYYTTSWRALGNGNYGYSFEGIECKIYPNQKPGTVPLYRYWNFRDNHFYTTNAKEIGTTRSGQFGKHGYQYEGIAGYCYPNDRAGVEPLYRFCNWIHNDHVYTTSLSQGRGLRYEGVACYVPK